MADQRRYERDQFRDDDNRSEDRQDWTYGRGRQAAQGRGDDNDRYQRSSYGRGSGSSYGSGSASAGGSSYGESQGRSRDRQFGERMGFEGDDRSPGFAGEQAARYGSSVSSDVYGTSERGGWREDSRRGEPRYGSGFGNAGGGYGYGSQRGSNENRDMWDRASDEVSSWFGDQDAERRRSMDKFRGHGPKNYVRSEDRIREDVSDRLTDDGGVDATEIDVSVSATEVTLAGTVPTRDQRRRAEMVAERVSGVTHVQNNVRVKDNSTSGFATGKS